MLIARVLLTLMLAFSAGLAAAQEARILRVCADPDHVPFIDRHGTGFENQILELLTKDLGIELQYYWLAYQTGATALRNNIDEGMCNAVVGLVRPLGRNMLLTEPYYSASYLIASLQQRDIHVRSLAELAETDLRIAVHNGSPPHYALLRLGTANLDATSFFAFPTSAPAATPLTIMDALARGEIDVAVVWAPIAVHAANNGLALNLIEAAADGEAIAMSFDIRIGVNSPALRDRLNAALERNAAAIDAIVRRYVSTDSGKSTTASATQ